jgi:hypothetical protein
MGDITNPKLIYTKGFLFLLAGVLSSAALILEHPTLKVVLLLGLAVWCFARFYYFAFYVIEHYVDSSYRFSGLGSFALYLLWRRSAAPIEDPVCQCSSPGDQEPGARGEPDAKTVPLTLPPNQLPGGTEE